MTKGEFNELTEELPDDSELIFQLIGIYSGTLIDKEVPIKDLGYEFSSGTNKPKIFLYDE